MTSRATFRELSAAPPEVLRALLQGRGVRLVHRACHFDELVKPATLADDLDRLVVLPSGAVHLAGLSFVTPPVARAEINLGRTFS